MGRWLKTNKAHKHDTPSHTSKRYPPGSIWECRCGAELIVTETTWHGDAKEDRWEYKWARA